MKFFAFLLAMSLAGAAFAGPKVEPPDEAKWHVDETAIVNGVAICPSPEAALAGLLAEDKYLLDNGIEPDEGFSRKVTEDLRVLLNAVQCEIGTNFQVTFLGVVPDTKIFRSESGETFYFVSFETEGVEFFTFINTKLVSELPL